MAGKGIPGLAVALAAAGGILAYAGFRNQNPLQALKEISGGKPAPVETKTVDLGFYQAGSAVAGAAGVAATAGVAGAAQKYANDQYSQARRTQPGWSDCSSFCDKILTDIGIPPPVKWASTANYRISPEWQTIPLSETKPGNIAVNSHHMVMILSAGGDQAIGQQNTRSDVRRGSVRDLMGSSFVCKRYVGKR